MGLDIYVFSFQGVSVKLRSTVNFSCWEYNPIECPMSVIKHKTLPLVALYTGVDDNDNAQLLIARSIWQSCLPDTGFASYAYSTTDLNTVNFVRDVTSTGLEPSGPIQNYTFCYTSV